jgi:hypothetical protein
VTEDELRNLSIPVKSFEDSFLRVMVRECDRRRAVLRGLTDSNPWEPWRVCDPVELKAWTKAHALTETQVQKQFLQGSSRNYGLTGRR